MLASEPSRAPNDAVFDRRLLVVTGKGGVGKSTVAAALAWRAARAGKRVLACELEPTGDLGAALAGAAGASPIGRGTHYEPDELYPRLWVMAMDPEASLKEYLKLNLRIPFLTKVGALSNVFDFLANAAPGVREIVTIGKVAWEVKERHYDLVVVDATASGHVVGLLRAPEAINELVGAGMIRGQTAWMLDVLRRGETTGVVVVTTAEELPVNETLSLCKELPTATGTHLAAVVVNRVLAPAEATTLERLVRAGVKTKTAKILNEATRIAAARWDAQQEQMARLEQLVPAHTEVRTVPLVIDSSSGLPITKAVAEALS